jgi:hypothetical protein
MPHHFCWEKYVWRDVGGTSKPGLGRAACLNTEGRIKALKRRRKESKQTGIQEFWYSVSFEDMVESEVSD